VVKNRTFEINLAYELEYKKFTPIKSYTTYCIMKGMERGKFYHYRQVNEIQKRKVILTPDPDTVFQKEIKNIDNRIRVVILPEGRTTLPKEKLYKF